MDRLIRLVLSFVIIAVAAASLAAQRRPFFIAVTDSKGAPHTSITAADLIVEVNGKPATVASVTPAAEPISIVVVTEGIPREGISDIRRMMKAAVDGAKAIHPDSRVGLMVEDGAAAPKMFTVTTDVAKLETAIGRFFESSRNAPLLDSLLTAAQTLQFEKHARRAILAVTWGYQTPSDVRSPTLIANAMRASGASLWMLDLGGRDDAMDAAELRVLSDVTSHSGGRRERTTPQSIAPLTERILATLRGQYAITLEDGLPAKAPSPKVTAKNKDLKILAPAWK